MPTERAPKRLRVSGRIQNQIATDQPFQQQTHQVPSQSGFNVSLANGSQPLAMPVPTASKSTIAVPSLSSPLSSSSSSSFAHRQTALGNANGKRALRGISLPRTIGGVPLEVAGLAMPMDVSPIETAAREAELDRELQFQRDHPPALPRSRIADLPPKPRSRPWSEFPDNISPERRREIEEENNTIAAENQKVERERNNAAAKKSRLKRIEALDNTRAILNDKAAECDWWRVKAMTLGARAADWASVPLSIRQAMVRDIAHRVSVIDSKIEEEKRVEDAKKRTERARARMAMKSPASSLSPEF